MTTNPCSLLPTPCSPLPAPSSQNINIVKKLLNHNVYTPHQGERVGFELIFPSTSDGTEENLIVIEVR
jgi:hypothetical protein